jgi:2-polyprenyl-3-methyl-5-hydroxy-6-metoxy-1,4-benzoquinol methylase
VEAPDKIGWIVRRMRRRALSREPSERRGMTSKYDTKVDLNSNYSHAQIVDLVGHGKRVLDVGAATGYLAEVLVARGCRVTGIELDPDAARQAERYCDRVIVGDLENMDLDAGIGEDRFDVIVFGDVLEHLKDPQRVLSRFGTFIGPAGYAVASIPNIAHASVRLALLQGEFRYRSLGLLDNTHLTFFTRETVEQLFEEAGFLISELRRTVKGVFDTEIEVDRDVVSEELLRQVQEDPEALTYQFVLKAYPFGENATLATYENLLYELTRKLRGFEEIESRLNVRTRQLAEREREIGKLTQEVVDLKSRLAKLVQSGAGEI